MADEDDCNDFVRKNNPSDFDASCRNSNNRSQRKQKSNEGKGPSRKNSNVANPQVTNSITPKKSPRDRNNYRVIMLSNGLRVVLVQQDVAQARLPHFHHKQQKKVYGFRQYQLQKQPVLGHKLPSEIFPISSLLDKELLSNSTDFPSRSTKAKIDCHSHSTSRPSDSNFAYVSLCVNVGFFQDPQEFHGLAHFVEHVVHAGSHKYPVEDEYLSLITHFGNGSLAFTEESTTTYYYNIREKYLSESLDQLANMLLDPLFDENMIQREVESIDNEFILKQHLVDHLLLCQSLAKKGHPFQNFGWGDRKTLGESAKCLKEAMQAFHAKYYVPGAMTLCVQGCASLDELQSLVVERFGKFDSSSKHSIRRNTTNKQSEMNPFKNSCNSMYVMQGCGVVSWLQLRWILPPEVCKDNEHKTLPILLDLIGNETESGLAHYMKNQGWTLNAFVDCCPCDHHWNDFNTILDFKIILTENGTNNLLQILSTCQSYIGSLSNLSEEKLNCLFTHLKNSEIKSFEYGGPGSPENLTLFAARSLQRHKPEDILVEDSWTNATFNYKRLVASIKLLDPKNLIVIHGLKSGEQLPAGYDIQQEKFSGLKYIKLYDPLPQTSSSYQFIITTENLFAKQFLNPFNVNDHGVIRAENLDLVTHNCSGTKVSACHYGHTTDTVYSGAVTLYLVSSCFSSSVLTRALRHVWENCLAYLLAPINCHAARIGYRLVMGAGHDSMAFRITGYPEKTVPIIRAVVKKWLLSNAIPENIFEMAKQSELANASTAMGFEFLEGWSTIKHIWNFIDGSDRELFTDTVNTLKDITHEDLIEFITLVKNCSYIFVEGNENVPLSAVAEITQLVSELQISPTWHNPLAESASEYILSLPMSDKCIRMKSECVTSECITVTNTYQLGSYEPLMYYMCQVVDMFMCSTSFHELRTKQQLGYVVCSYLSPVGYPIAFKIGITTTASKFTPCELDKRIDEFLYDFNILFQNIPESTFLEVKQQLNVPPPVTRAMICEWVLSKFNIKHSDLGSNKHLNWSERGVRKMTIQILGINGKTCDCSRCKSVTGWTAIREQLLLASEVSETGNETNNQTSKYFIDDLQTFRDSLL